MNTEEIQQGYQRHAALTQLYRWYLYYENPDYGIDNALDILSEDISIKSGLGEANGHDEYAARVEQLPEHWKNAHDVHRSAIDIDEQGNMQLTTSITYLNQGLLDGDAVRAAELSYSMALTQQPSLLPKFTSIAIEQDSDGLAEEFVPSYVQNRVLSLVHYWLALIEDPSRNPEPVREILADEFKLDFLSGAITSFEQFQSWLAGPASQVVASTHRIHHFESDKLADNLYSASMEFDWNGILPDGTEMTARTRHHWRVEDVPSERFARIQSINVDILEPFTEKQ